MLDIVSTWTQEVDIKSAYKESMELDASFSERWNRFEQKVKEKRLEAGLNFLNRIEKSSDPDLNHFITLEPVINDNDSYKEEFVIDLSANSEWFKCLKAHQKT
jgi:hypothetical protein